MTLETHQYRGITFFLEVGLDISVKIEDGRVWVYYKYMNKKDRVVNLDDFIDENTIGPIFLRIA